MNEQNIKELKQVPDAEVPKYRDIANQIIQDVTKRKTHIFLRALLTLLPLFLAFAILFIVYAITNGDSEKSNVVVNIALVVMFVLFAITPGWLLVVSHIIKVEQIIWVDSYFDNVKLDQGQSWSIATKLFWPAVILNAHVFVRYYLLPFAVLVVIVITYIYAVTHGGISFNILQPVIGVIAMLILFSVFNLLVNVRLRYVWFLFVDSHGTPGFTFSNVFKEANTLNQAYKEDTFKKLVITMVGIDTTHAAADTALIASSMLLSKFGAPGKIAALITGTAGGQNAALLAQFAKVVAMYIFYRAARTVVYGTSQYVNEELYKKS